MQQPAWCCIAGPPPSAYIPPWKHGVRTPQNSGTIFMNANVQTVADGQNAPAQAGSNILLNVNGIEVIYNHVILVLKGVSLCVPEGRIVALLGANGAGKTTTLRAVSNLLKAERGDVAKGSIDFR